MTQDLNVQPTLLNVYEYRHFIYGDKFVPIPKDDDSLEVNFENTLLKILIGECSNLIFKQQITEDNVKSLSLLSECEDCSFEKLNHFFESIGLSITDVTDDYVCFEIKKSVEEIDIKLLLEQLLCIASQL